MSEEDVHATQRMLERNTRDILEELKLHEQAFPVETIGDMTPEIADTDGFIRFVPISAVNMMLKEYGSES